MYTVCHKSLPKLSFFFEATCQTLASCTLNKSTALSQNYSLTFSYGFLQVLVEDAAIFLQMEAMDSI